MKKLAISILIVFMIITTGCSSTKNLDVESYLEKNSSTINLNDTTSFDGLNLINDNLKGKKVILSGGFKGLNKDDLLNIKLVKYLQRKVGLSYYLAEIGYSDAYFLNEYLKNGDENTLNKVFLNMKKTAMFNENDYNFFTNLYKFNNSLQEKEKIKIVGIEIEKNMGNSYDYIKKTIKNEKLVTKELENLFKSLQNLNLYLEKTTPQNEDKNYEKDLFNDLNLKIDTLTDHINKKKYLYTSLFQKDFFGFEIVIKNLKANCLSELSSDSNESLRIIEDQIYNNFIIQDKKIDNAIYFGEFASPRINKVPINSYDKFESFASKINKNDKYKGKVISILYSYLDLYGCEYSVSIDQNLFNPYLKNIDDCILFDLRNIGSPFKESFISPFYKEKMYDNKKYITDYIDYMVIIKSVSESSKLNF